MAGHMNQESKSHRTLIQMYPNTSHLSIDPLFSPDVNIEYYKVLLYIYISISIYLFIYIYISGYTHILVGINLFPATGVDTCCGS